MYLFIIIAVIAVYFVTKLPSRRFTDSDIKIRRYVVIEFEDDINLFKSPVCFDRLEKRLYYYNIHEKKFVACKVEHYKHRAMFCMMNANLKRRDIVTKKLSFETLVNARDSINPDNLK